MGFLKDYNNIKKETRKIRENSPRAGVRMAEMGQKMADLNASLLQTAALSAPAPGSVPAQVQLVAVSPTTASLNGQPMMDVTVTVLAQGCPPVPASARILVPLTSMHRLQPGVTLPARVDPADLAAFAIDWTAPG
ncbi:MAG: hypothetical protein ABIP03_13310 [Aquihabitans sp.]